MSEEPEKVDDGKITDEQLSDMLFEHLKKAARELGTKFDTVQIVATHHEGGTEATRLQFFGIGNFYARTGSVKAWLARDNEDDRIMARNARKSADDDDDEFAS